MREKGMLHCIGVGPGDPELLTLKAVRLIGECDVIAVPDSGAEEQIALQTVRDLISDQTVLSLHSPMVYDRAALEQARELAADQICEYLSEGKTVAWLTIGDPSIYSTAIYMMRIVQSRGYETQMTAGVPSFCAAAASLGMPLCETGQALHILPVSRCEEADLSLPGTRVMMKSGRQMQSLLNRLREQNMLQHAALAERIGLEGEQLVPDLSDYSGDPGYLSLVIVKEPQERSAEQ